MIGKLVRAVSGLHGALVLAKAGYITECAVVLRTVSDFCTEIETIGWFVAKDERLPGAVQEFVNSTSCRGRGRLRNSRRRHACGT